MGCTCSKADINDRHPNIFQVMNVDELGNWLSHGQLEITESDLVLYQKKKDPIKWPLRCLRRYGFDADLFSFECGRRCPTGPGIYAFRCQRAELLFNLLQSHIQVRNSAGEDAVSQEFQVPSAAGSSVASRLSIGGDSTYLELSTLRSGIRVNAPNSIRFSSQNGGGSTRLGSVGSSSNGPISPQGTASPSPPPATIPSFPGLPVTSSNNSNLYNANEELFMASAATTTTTTTTTITTTTTTTTTTTVATTTTTVAPVEPSERRIEQLQRTVRETYFNGESIPCTVILPVTVDGNKSACRQSVGNGDAITTNISVETMSCTQTYLTPSYINADLGAGVEPVSPTCSLNGESTYACHNLTNESKQCHLYMNVIPGPENGVSAAPDKPPATIWPKPALPCSGMRQQEWELEESRHCYANLEPGEIEVARSHIPKRVSGTERVPPLLLLSPTVQSQQNPLTSPPGVAETLNYIELNLEQNKTDSVAGNVNSPVGSVPPATLSVPPDSPRRGAEGYATIDYDRTAALSHSVNPNVYYDCEGLRRTRHNSNINDPVAPSTRLSSSD